ncbi:hypothetical protein C8R47DRAFT_1168872 [Mycena vitilis]|nr:hypothetical protein C8R47DRAFT_1168872 [Mycena vitilis]
MARASPSSPPSSPSASASSPASSSLSTASLLFVAVPPFFAFAAFGAFVLLLAGADDARFRFLPAFSFCSTSSASSSGSSPAASRTHQPAPKTRSRGTDPQRPTRPPRPSSSPCSCACASSRRADCRRALPPMRRGRGPARGGVSVGHGRQRKTQRWGRCREYGRRIGLDAGTAAADAGV